MKNEKRWAFISNCDITAENPCPSCGMELKIVEDIESTSLGFKTLECSVCHKTYWVMYDEAEIINGSK